MAMKHPYEFWCVTAEGVKKHEYFNYSSTRRSKIEAYIEKKYKFVIADCKDFWLKRNPDI